MGSQLTLPCVASAAQPSAAPVLKWAGGKRRLLSQLQPLLPNGVKWMRHVEPFLGGGALFFSRQPSSAVLADKNPHLCTTYEVIRDDVELLIERLRELAAQHDLDRYYECRTTYNRTDLARVERAALFIYLNRTCVNGLYRVNRQGKFNVSAGSYTNPRIVNADGLRAASQALRRAQLHRGDFEAVLTLARAGDFVYLDPPYVPVSATSSFTAYDADGFTMDDQVRLRAVFGELDRRGCMVMLSNSAATEVRELYEDYELDIVETRRSISCAGNARGIVEEIVVRNYGGGGSALRRRAAKSDVQRVQLMLSSGPQAWSCCEGSL